MSIHAHVDSLPVWVTGMGGLAHFHEKHVVSWQTRCLISSNEGDIQDLFGAYYVL